MGLFFGDCHFVSGTGRLSDIICILSDGDCYEGVKTMATVRISVRLDADTERRLRQEARAAGKNESDVVREALETVPTPAAEDVAPRA